MSLNQNQDKILTEKTTKRRPIYSSEETVRVIVHIDSVLRDEGSLSWEGFVKRVLSRQ